MASLKDVAKRASVSLMTVSRAINDPDKLNKETYKRVKQAIDDLNYVPDLSAKKIRGNQSCPRFIGVLALETATSPFSVELLLAIEKTAQKYKWNTFIVNLFEDRHANDAINTLLSYRPDGIIYTTMGLRKITLPAKLRNENIVLANCITDSTAVATYIPDDFNGQYQAVKQVLAKGYKKPLCIHLPESTLAGTIRRKAVELAWLESGNSIDNMITYHLPKIEDAPEQEYWGIVDILKKHIINNKPDFDVVICANDRAALLTYHVLLGKGLRIPDNVAVLGYDNMVGIGTLFYPPLTTVTLPHYQIGEQAALHLIKGLTHKETVKIDSPYLERASL